jgi:hypothetical protein
MAKARTPVTVFAYKRAEHAARLLESLSRNVGVESCDIHIFCDGPKTDREAEEVRACRDAVAPWACLLNARVYESGPNLGLAGSIVAGVTKLCQEYGRVVVLEDDLVTSPHFLSFMIRALDAYETCERVCQVTGYSFPAGYKSAPDAFFLPVTSTWGWATWARAWQLWRNDAIGYETFLANRSERREFNVDGSYPYDEMLKRQVATGIDSWGIFWHYAVRRAGGLVLWPRQSLVWNGGADGTGTHGARGSAFNGETLVEFLARPVKREWDMPPAVGVDSCAYKTTAAFLKKLAPRKKPLFRRGMDYAHRRLAGTSGKKQ